MVSKHVQEILDIINAPLSEDEQRQWKQLEARQELNRKHCSPEVLELLETDWSNTTAISHAELMDQARRADARRADARRAA